MTRSLTGWTAAFGLTVLLVAPATAHAQADDPAALKLAEPDFTLVGLPTSLRLPTFKSAFRVTHRFTRPLNCPEVTQGAISAMCSPIFSASTPAP